MQLRRALPNGQQTTCELEAANSCILDDTDDVRELDLDLDAELCPCAQSWSWPLPLTPTGYGPGSLRRRFFALSIVPILSRIALSSLSLRPYLNARPFSPNGCTYKRKSKY
ncbi:unnamed protein product [Cyclocybe aegerita]|uniref:Uncharacterized protein n=1 Tax=Cyclocybe aegerita TaxID=1973307 RepID=A0A8S0X937_CYCAE|nr:unnamed protein product [Cyclocybe aegerita]